jgi:hypothetical protein
MSHAWSIIILLYVIFNKNITFLHIEIDRYKKVVLWGFAMILLIMAKINIETVGPLALVGIGIISLIPLFLREKHDSNN